MHYPLLEKWDTPFGIPPFAQFKDNEYEPALIDAMALASENTLAIAQNKEPPSFTNTIEALEKSDTILAQAISVFFNLTSSNTNPVLQETEIAISPKLAEYTSNILLNDALFERIDMLENNRENLGLNEEQLRVLERYHTSFKRAGAGLPKAEKAEIAAINQELATLGTEFAQNVLKDEADYVLLLENESDLAGLPPYQVEAARQAALERDYSSGYAITLSRSSYEPFLQSSSRRDLREKLFKAFASRGEGKNEAIIQRTLELRQRKAQLLGFDNFAAFKLDDMMAGSVEAVMQLLMQVWLPARQKALEETNSLLQVASKDTGQNELQPWDWRYYAEKVRKQNYDLNEDEIKPYLQLDNIIEAAFYTAHKLFQVSFKPLSDLKLYHEDCRAFEMLGPDGKHLGVFIGDYFARTSKRSGAWMSDFRSQQKLVGDITPIIVNVMNFSKPVGDAPCLLTLEDARTLFHEFGHALHGLLSQVTYPRISGTNVARDFVELPSQLFEHWLEQPEILQKFAIHYQENSPIPNELIDKIKAAENFNQGFQTVEYLATAIIDMRYHQQTDAGIDTHIEEQKILTEIEMPEAIIMRHRPTHLLHAFAGDGYSAGYYSYLWSEVMDADAFTAFEESEDIFQPELAQKLKKYIYSSGGKLQPEDAYLLFRGKTPTPHALLKGRGLL
ncbi:M3 family metallopeptidase [Polycladidibacter stylochi]|uniref:M3 family metallopeptidase n=1 Tax=Polycladidibacter stylochi TaxID=1807766 RepID=UPI00082D2952|nr:M3 family metallopeptidase [Pseudovibrio stylochi]